MAQESRYGSHDDPYEPRYPSYDDQFAEPVDLDEFGSQLRSYQPTRSLATREEFMPDDSVPLFLSGSEGISRTPRFGSAGRGSSSRLLKAGILVVAAGAAAFTAVAVKNPFTVFANATASLIGSPDVRSPPVPVAEIPPATPVRAASPATNQGPSRDEIAGALRAAHQNVAPAETAAPAAVAPVAAVAPMVAATPPAPPAPPVVSTPPVTSAPPLISTPPVAATPPAAVAPPAAAAPPARKLAPDELAALMTRAKALLVAGDIPPARLLLERAAEANEASAALMLAQTYDPMVVGRQDRRNINIDPELARTWYQRAAQLGSADAQRRLSQLQ
jgi:hypothetical protein